MSSKNFILISISSIMVIGVIVVLAIVLLPKPQSVQTPQANQQSQQLPSKEEQNIQQQSYVSIDSTVIVQFEGKVSTRLKEIPIVKNGDLFIANKNGEILRQLTNHKGVQSFLVSPSGSYVAYIHAKGTFSHPGVPMYFDGSLNLKIIDILLGKELRNIFLGKFQVSPSLEYFWNYDSQYIYISFNQDFETETEYKEKDFWIQYDIKESKSKFLTKQEFDQKKKLATTSINGFADLTSFNYPIINNQRELLTPLFEDLYDKISKEAKNTLSARYQESTIYSQDYSFSYQYSSSPKEAFVLMANIVFSPNLKKAVVYLEPTNCENMEYMITFATPIFVIDLTSGKITEISKPHRFLSLIWIDDESFLISDRIIYLINLTQEEYAIKRFLPQDKDFINSCEVQSGPSITLPCDGLGESLGPVEILTDPCSA